MSRAHSPTFPSLHLRHNSFSNPSIASPTSQLILQPFFCFSYVTGSSLMSSGELPMTRFINTCQKKQKHNTARGTGAIKLMQYVSYSAGRGSSVALLNLHQSLTLPNSDREVSYNLQYWIPGILIVPYPVFDILNVYIGRF